LRGAVKAVDAGVDGLIVEGAESAGIRDPEEVHTFALAPALLGRRGRRDARAPAAQRHAPAGIAVQQQRRHLPGIERRLAHLAADRLMISLRSRLSRTSDTISRLI
jgi:hypothetical protein